MTATSLPHKAILLVIGAHAHNFAGAAMVAFNATTTQILLGPHLLIPLVGPLVPVFSATALNTK
jgi:hypothetical protein